MATAQSPIGATVPGPAENGLGRLAAWCYDHRAACWPAGCFAVMAIIALATASQSASSIGHILPSWRFMVMNCQPARM